MFRAFVQYSFLLPILIFIVHLFKRILHCYCLKKNWIYTMYFYLLFLCSKESNILTVKKKSNSINSESYKHNLSFWRFHKRIDGTRQITFTNMDIIWSFLAGKVSLCTTIKMILDWDNQNRWQLFYGKFASLSSLQLKRHVR